MTQKFRVKQRVNWKHAGNVATGKIVETFKQKVTRKLQGSEITRNATEEEPAYLIEQEDGGRVLKSESELTGA